VATVCEPHEAVRANAARERPNTNDRVERLTSSTPRLSRGLMTSGRRAGTGRGAPGQEAFTAAGGYDPCLVVVYVLLPDLLSFGWPGDERGRLFAAPGKLRTVRIQPPTTAGHSDTMQLGKVRWEAERG
jgi:hypothetical protein